MHTKCMLVIYTYLRGSPFNGNFTSVRYVVVLVHQISRHPKISDLYINETTCSRLHTLNWTKYYITIVKSTVFVMVTIGTKISSCNREKTWLLYRDATTWI